MQDAVIAAAPVLDESPLAFVRDYSSSNNQYLQQAALLYLATTDQITLALAQSASAPTAFLGAFITVFENLMQQGGKPDQYKLGGIAFLISKIIPRVNAAVLQHLFDRITTLFISALQRFADITFVAKTLLQCISVALRYIPTKTVETSPSCKKMIQALFIFSVDPRPKIRKPAQSATDRVFRTLSTNSVNYLVPKQFEECLIEFCKIEFEVTDQSTKDCTAALHLCGLLKEVMYCLSTAGVAAIIAPLLQLTAQGNPFLLLQCFYTIASLYTKGFEFSTCLLVLQQSTSSAQSQVPAFLKDFSTNLRLTSAQQFAHINKDIEFSYQLLLSVLDLKPNSNDVNGNRAFNTVLTAMYRVLYSFDPTRAMTKIVDILQSLHDTLLNATKSEIVNSTLLTIKHILIVTLSTHRLDTDRDNTDLTFSSKTVPGAKGTPPPPSVRAILVYVRQLFMLPSMDKTTLTTMLDIVTSAMTHASRHHFDYFHELIIIIETYHQKAHGNDKIQSACEAVIGNAIQHFGPENINTILPLNLPQSSLVNADNTVVTQLKESRIWLLQLYPHYVRNATLEYFLLNLLPTAADLFQLSIAARQGGRSQEANLLKDIIIFIWEAFPSFCLLPSDVTTMFKPLMKELVLHYTSDQFAAICQQPICKGLRNICAKNLAIVNNRWGKHDDLGLQRYSLDDDDLVLLHTPEQLRVYLNRRETKGKTAPGQDDDDSDDDEDDEEENTGAKLNTRGEQDNDAELEDVDDDDDDLGLYNQTTSIARKRANNRLYNKKQIISAPIGVQEAQTNCAAIGALSKNILPLLFNTVVNTFRDNDTLSSSQAQSIPIVLDAILAYTCTAVDKTREQFFNIAFEQFLQTSKEITTVYNAINNFQDDDDDEMPSLDKAMSRPHVNDAAEPIRKSRALTDILVAMSPALSNQRVILFLQSIILNFNSPSEILQKKAYATVQALITVNKTIFDVEWKTVLIAVSTSSANIQTTAHRSRLSLCRSLYSHLQSPLEHREVLSTLPPLLSEAILATKESNNKLRVAALDLTIAIGINIYNSGLSTKGQSPAIPPPPDQKNHSGEQLLTQYITMVLAGLAATTPRMLSATINVLARLVFEFKSVLVEQTIIHDIFQTIMILLPSKSREILKSILAFIKVAVVILPLDLLRNHVKELLYAISEWRPSEKSHFKRPVRVLYQLFVKKFGFDFMRTVTPADDLRLVEYLRKNQLRMQNQRNRELKEQKNAMGETNKVIKAVFGAEKLPKNAGAAANDDGEEDFVDVHRYHAGLSFDEILGLDNEDDMDAGLGYTAADLLQRSVGTGKKDKKKKNRFADDEMVSLGDSTDFLETNISAKLQSKIRGGKGSHSSMGLDDDDDDNDDRSAGVKRKSQGGVVNKDGKLDFTSLERTIVDEERQAKLDARVPSEYEIKDQRKKQRLLAIQHKEEKMETHAQKNKQKLGAEFTSTKGAGDVKRRGVKYDPYAYVPLDPRTLNTKKLSLRQQSQRFAGMFEKNAVTGGTASQRGPGQRLTRAQRAAMRKKGGKYTKARAEEE